MTHACCNGTPRGLCAAHEAQGSRFMAALFWKFDSTKGMWVHQRELQRAHQALAYCRRFHGLDCTRKECQASASYEHPKPAHRPPDGHVWDAASGKWVEDPSKEPKEAKARLPSPLQGRPSNEEKLTWLRRFSEFDGREWGLAEYRAAYKKAKRPENDSERRVQARRESPAQQHAHRMWHKKSERREGG